MACKIRNILRLAKNREFFYHTRKQTGQMPAKANGFYAREKAGAHGVPKSHWLCKIGLLAALALMLFVLATRLYVAGIIALCWRQQGGKRLFFIGAPIAKRV